MPGIAAGLARTTNQLLLIVLVGLASYAHAASAPLADFARNDSYDNATISPDGRYVALTLPIGRVRGLAVYDLVARKIVSKSTVGVRRSVYQYLWASDRRLVVSLAKDSDYLDRPAATGELIAFDVDGSNQQYLFGYLAAYAESDALTGTLQVFGKKKFAAATPIRALPNDPQHILISVHAWDGDDDPGLANVYRMDVATGKLDRSLAAPKAGPAYFLADDDGFVRFSVGQEGSEWRGLAFSRAPDKPEWKQLAIPPGGESSSITPLFLSRDSGRVFLKSRDDGDFECLVEQNLVSGVRRRLACDIESDLVDALPSFDRDEPILVRFAAGREESRLLENGNPGREKLADLIKAFPGQNVLPVSVTRDGTKAIVLVNSDRNPGDYYLFDTAKLEADYLVGRSNWLDPDGMPERRPIEYRARDGQRIHGYLTLPPGRKAKYLPLVVNPHGGPFGTHDEWQFDPESAALATRGYAVLQMNFRGSDGFGGTFAKAGKRGWATTMVDDITDGTRWAVEQGYADPARIAIYGTSYGGYAALMSAIREPDLYRCVTTYAGLFDLPTWKSDSDVATRRSGRRYIDDFIGADEKSLREASPSNYIDRLKIPVLIVHGTDDERVPFSQAKQLRWALDQRDHPYEWLVKGGEGHGFYRLENRPDFLTRLVAFLDLYLAPSTSKTTVPP